MDQSNHPGNYRPFGYDTAWDENGRPYDRTKSAPADLADVWCRHCADPAVRVVSGEAYCANHAMLQDFRLHSTSWNPSTDR